MELPFCMVTTLPNLACNLWKRRLVLATRPVRNSLSWNDFFLSFDFLPWTLHGQRSARRIGIQEVFNELVVIGVNGTHYSLHQFSLDLEESRFHLDLVFHRTLCVLSLCLEWVHFFNQSLICHKWLLYFALIRQGWAYCCEVYQRMCGLWI